MTAVDVTRPGQPARHERESGESPAATGDHGGKSALALAGTVAHDLLVVVASSRGRFRPCVQPGQRLEAETLVGRVEGGNGRADEVRLPAAAVLHAFLVGDNEFVRQGQSLAWGQKTG